jgi:hypothetical protein
VVELNRIAGWLKWLGTGDAATDMGAIEYLASSVKESNALLAEAVRELAKETGNVAAQSTKLVAMLSSSTASLSRSAS